MKKVKIESRAANISLLGGALCLDFVNTVDWRTSNKPEEFLNSYRDLIDWSGHAGIVDDRRAGRLMRRAASHPALAAAAFQQAIELREAIYQVFAALSHARPPARRQLEKFNLALSALISRARIKPDQDCFAWQSEDPNALDSILWPVAWSAAQLLISQDVQLVRQCAGEGCGWLFLDNSRSHRRQWCNMTVCGNRAKARRYYQRLKSGK
jgi:predicted RNA-binding Zn ribbon-like protein